MATASSPLLPPPPPPPPRAPCERRPVSEPPPIPGHAALPFFPSPPIQETSPTPEARRENAPVTPSLSEQNELQFPPSDESTGPRYQCDGDEKTAPVQETEPASQTQTMEQQEEVDQRTDPDEEGEQPRSAFG